MTEYADDHGREAEQRAGRWLAAANLRPTRQRMALAKLLIGDGGNRHFTADSLYEAVRRSDQKVSLATVYNTLKSFTEAGLIMEIPVDGARTYFDTNTSEHAHFFWEDQGRVSDAPFGAVRFENLPAPPDGTEIARVEVVIRLRPKQP